ncbi:uncharacterized protein MONOS_1074 [Monocercomonoides exilis]|uniref:uncharacterized protein n=1 Tax=Monocercomonoides exilis TaxID=2049356 RepID=UPI00355AB8B1|nr:hypothetical protein MONOS_1074 [Monocercomonoides exilis]|eukprot:MONOS_1074.1-p1 / transcript=MONOS_1074.1 / gene=MONOS_1074 / organism=Monocercomonoides_exilis_PA203 / gene_product=unspecified product / transcript_product=unspecified product / location=Mono_scaffold00018:97100-97849(-) / protein_length=250 / sequence_SO=supercontig / SO=protein_coding / is_pseudo=false
MEHLQIKESVTEQHESNSSFGVFPFFSQKTTVKHLHEEINPLLLKASIGTSYTSLFSLLNDDATEESRATAIQKMDLILGDLQMLIEETESMMPFEQVNALIGEALQQMKSGMNGYASQMCSDLGLESWRLRFVLSGGLSALLSLLMESPLFQNEIYLQPLPPSTLATVVRVVSAFILEAQATSTLGSQSSGSYSIESSDALPSLLLFNNTLEYSILHVPIVVQTINATLSEDKTHYVPLPPVMLEPEK